MEAQGGAEVRRLHIIYFLSRKGSIEHPHLIRVHHLSRNGVRLRDIKRWLRELRGKEIPESYSWSYKRRYKTGYVWQDLLDDDLITPISDNEYVLKGSEISSTTNKEFSFTEEKVGKQEEQKTLCKEENLSHSSETSNYVSTKSSSEIEEESQIFGSETSTLTDDSGRVEMEKNTETKKHDQKPISDSKIERSSTFYFKLLRKKNKKKSKKVTIDEKISTEAAAAADSSKSPSSESQSTKSKSQILRNLITCGDVDTNDSAIKTMKKQNKPFLNMCSSDIGNVNSAAICKREIIGGSQRIFGNPSWTQQQWSGRKSYDGVMDSATCAAYKPVNGPNCSQCGKPFKPEKLHSHMKSCKGVKATMSKIAAKAAVSVAAEKASMEFQHGATFAGHLLTH